MRYDTVRDHGQVGIFDALTNMVLHYIILAKMLVCLTLERRPVLNFGSSCFFGRCCGLYHPISHGMEWV